MVTHDDIRLLDNLEVHERDDDRKAPNSGLAFYVREDELRQVDQDGHVVRSLADDAFGWIMNNVLSTTVSTAGSVTFEYDRVELREPGDGAATSQTRVYNSSVGIDPSESGSIRINCSNVNLVNNASARLYLQLSDAPDGNGASGNDYVGAEIRGDGEIRALTSEGGTAGNSADTSQDNAYINGIHFIDVQWDGSSVTVTVYDGSTFVTVSDSSNYPSGENLHLAIKAEDQDGSNQRNVDFDVNRIKRT